MNKFCLSPFLIIMLVCTSMSHFPQPNELGQLNSINKKIWKYSRKKHEPTFEITKLAYTNLTKLGSKQIYECLNEETQSTNRVMFQILPSITIHEGDQNAFPAIVRFCEQYYSVNGYKLANFQSKNTFDPNPHENVTPLNTNIKYQHFVSSVRNEFTYFAEVEWGQSTKGEMGGSRINIKKLQQKNKKINLQEQLTLQLQPKYGEVTGFVNSFALSLKLFAFSTSKGYVIFYRVDGKMENIYRFGYHQENGSSQFSVKIGQTGQNPRQIVLRLAKLNNHIAIYTQKLDNRSFIYTIGTNSKNSTIKKFTIPKIESHSLEQNLIELKYSDNNWNQFFVKIGPKVYVYDQLNALPLFGHSMPQQAQYQNNPVHWFPLLDAKSQFFVAGSMLIVQPSLSDPASIHPYRFYYNMSLNSGQPFQFRLPINICEQSNRRPLMGISSQNLGNHIICVYCNYAYQCYSLSSSTDGLTNTKLDYTDYSKFRVPLVILSLGVVIFISVTRSKKNSGKSIEQQKEEEQFMKQLQKRDKNLYEELKRNKKGQPNSKANNSTNPVFENNRTGQLNKNKKTNINNQLQRPMFRQFI